MDYSDLASHFAGSVEIKPVTPRRVAEMQEAYERFAPAFQYPGDWPIVLKSMKRWFTDHRVRSLEARVRIVPPVIQVSVPEVRI